MLTPDTAHGTNPATVTMAGYEVVKVGTAPDGGVDLDDLREKAAKRWPARCSRTRTRSTSSTAISRRSRRSCTTSGATLYYDGANLNAVMGVARPGDMGFDIVHFNLHKTFTQPHGGGGPGAGPIACSDRIEPFPPVPQVVEAATAASTSDLERPKSIGLRGFQGTLGVRALPRVHLLARRGRLEGRF